MRELIDPTSHQWNISAIRDSLSLDCVIHAIKTPIGWMSLEDKLFWPSSKDGNCSVKSGYGC